MATQSVESQNFINSLQNPKKVTPKPQQLGQQDFLRLLTTQLANQDPTKPMDPKEFVTDMFNFANLQQIQDLNDNISQMYQASLNTQAMQSASLIGQYVMVEDNAFQFNQEGDKSLAVYANKNLSNVQINLVSASGEVIRSWDYDTLPKGKKTLTWDGLTNEGNLAPAGEYKIVASGVDETGKRQAMNTQVSQKVSQINIQDPANIMVSLDSGKEIPYSQIKQIGL